MGSNMGQLINRFRQPEYTGENRCIPCTIVNLVLALGAAIGASVVTTPLGGGGIFVISVILIYYRGYLIPGTPMLTKRYLPNRVLRWFGKTPFSTGKLNKGAQTLQNAGLLVPCEDRNDLCLEDGFEIDWQRRIDDLETDEFKARLKTFLDTENVIIKDTENGTYVSVGNKPTMPRRSRLALKADIAVLPLLRDRCPNWNQLSVAQSSDIMRALRVFLNFCPACSAELTLDHDIVESCCQKQMVYSLSCEECSIQIAEVPADT